MMKWDAKVEGLREEPKNKKQETRSKKQKTRNKKIRSTKSGSWSSGVHSYVKCRI